MYAIKIYTMGIAWSAYHNVQRWWACSREFFKLLALKSFKICLFEIYWFRWKMFQTPILTFVLWYDFIFHVVNTCKCTWPVIAAYIIRLTIFFNVSHSVYSCLTSSEYHIWYLEWHERLLFVMAICLTSSQEDFYFWYRRTLCIRLLWMCLLYYKWHIITTLNTNGNKCISPWVLEEKRSRKQILNIVLVSYFCTMLLNTSKRQIHKWCLHVKSYV